MKKIYFTTIYFLIGLFGTLSPIFVFAATEGVPVKFVLSQIFNFSVFTFLIFYLLKKKVSPILKQKNEEFKAQRDQAQVEEEKHKLACVKWEEKIKNLKEKDQNIKNSVSKALKLFQEETQKEQQKNKEVLQSLMEADQKRQKFKELSLLKTNLLALVVQKAKENLNQNPPQKFKEGELTL